jgi:hypothetical protein
MQIIWSVQVMRPPRQCPSKTQNSNQHNTGEGVVTDLGSLESNDHVGGRSKHCWVSGDGCRECHLKPGVIWCTVSGKVAASIWQTDDAEHETVNARPLGHLCSTSTHSKCGEVLRNTNVVIGSNQNELANKEHQMMAMIASVRVVSDCDRCWR